MRTVASWIYNNDKDRKQERRMRVVMNDYEGSDDVKSQRGHGHALNDVHGYLYCAQSESTILWNSYHVFLIP